MKIVSILLHVLSFVMLTIISQIGGLVYLISIFLAKRLRIKFKAKTPIVFIIVYSISTFLIVPNLAPVFGRQKIENTSQLQPVNYFTIVLNRNYVSKELNKCLASVASELSKSNSGIQVRYLDACFPFVSGFPLLPHLSHNDGKKMDLSLVYEDEKGTIVNKSKSFSGYGVFEEYRNHEFNLNDFCKESGHFQYDFPKYLSFGEINNELRFSKKGTKLLIQVILKQDKLEKLFIEPHLKKRMGLVDNRIRFQGCKSVRHDDHIHIQIY